VLALLDRLGLRRVRAIGLSLGAKTLLHMAAIQPDRLEAMVLYPVELAVELFRGIPSSALWVVPSGGHGPIVGALAPAFAAAAIGYIT
jgi:pimeloyl-ACP methyl ester carboxylesterase